MLCNTAAPPATSVQFQFRVSTANIQRKTYFLGSQAIIARVSGDRMGITGCSIFTATILRRAQDKLGFHQPDERRQWAEG
jgi:hypothetical protein